VDSRKVTHVYRATYWGRLDTFPPGAELLVYEKVRSFDWPDRQGAPPNRTATSQLFIGLATEEPWYLIGYTGDLHDIRYLGTKVDG
jgi:hypothetical protein